MNLEKLTGSEKQAKWANDIRNKFTEELERVNARMTETDAPDVIKRIIKNVGENTLKNTTAHWWIENRHQTQIRISGHIVNEIFMGIGKYLGESLRTLAFEDIRKACDRMEEIGFKDLDDEGLWVLIDQILQGKQPERSIIAVTKEERAAEAEFEAERIAACTIRPENPKSELPVKIKIIEHRELNFKGFYAIRTTEWNEEISKKMKRLRFSWESGEWRKFYVDSFSDWEERVVEAATMGVI